ncbi:MAG TPA: APC family permease [Candidatus Acidoferrales bacterium]|nr:APC family permease [Candidatus Acidoferrales bacterium]
MTEQVFIRKASGLTRVIGPWTALAYAFMNPGIMYGFLYLIWTHQLYPGVDMPIAAAIAVPLMFIPALLYIWFSISMPRSGGEYIWGSRIISPAWGFAAGWSLSMVGLSWAGSCIYWAISYGANMIPRALAISQGGANFANQPLWATANLIDSTPVLLPLGTALIISFMAIMWRGPKASMFLAWIGVVAGTVGTAAFVIGVMTGGGLPSFISGFNAMSGTTYDAVLNTARSSGWPVGTYILGVSATGGITYVALNTLGSTYTANIIGEIKDVKKSAILAMLGALVLFFIYWEIFYSSAYFGFSGDFWAAASYFAPGGSGSGTWNGWPFGAVMPMPNLMLVFLNSNVWYSVLASLGFAVSTYASCMGMAFGPVRNLFAYSFDRVLPTAFSSTDRRGSPWAAVALGTVIAEIFFLINVFYYTWIAYSILAWFFAWAIVGLIGVIYPYTSRGKQIFEKSPEIVKKKVIGIPLITIFGVVTFLISIYIDYYMLMPFFQGLASSLYIWITATMFIIPSFVIYYLSRIYHRAKHVPMELQFKEIPPD